MNVFGILAACARLTLPLFLVVLVLFPLSAGAAMPEFTPQEKAFIEEHPVITLSDVDWQPLSNVDDGRQEGLFHDYYGLIEKRTGLAFRFVPLGDGRDFQVVLDALRERRIDMIDGTGKTADRAGYALFAGPFFNFPLAVASRDDGVAYSLETLTGKRVAVARGSTAEEYLREHAPGLDLVETVDPAAALMLVATHKAEAAVENMAVAAYVIRKSGLANVKIAGVLDYEFKIWSLVRSDWPLLASILQKAHDSVSASERAALLTKWLPVYTSGLQNEETPGQPVAAEARGSIVLTDKERDYLARKKALAYCVDPDWPPIERIDENGRHVGITADYLKLMRERLGGVSMVLVPTSSWSQSLAAVKARRCDFLPAAGETNDRRRFMRFTSPYLRFPMVVATQSKAPFLESPASLAGKKLGVVNGYAILDILRIKYPGIQLMEVPSVAEGLRLVSDGRLYGYIDTVPAISQAIAKGQFADLKIAGRLEQAHLDLAVASRDDEPELSSILQKAVNSITKEDAEAITKRWVAVTFEQGFDYTLLWRIVAGAALVLAIVIWWNRKLSRLNRALTQAHEALDNTNRRMAVLLDNAGQGFLSVDRDGLIDPQYSRECREIFGGDIEGRSLPELLYDAPDGRETMAVNIRRIVGETDAYRRDLYISLMPGHVVRGGATLRLAYRPLAGDRLMCVVTDVTGEVRLKDAVARERNRLACVVAAVREQRDFFAVLDAFAAFRRDGAALAEAPDGPRAGLDAVYRQVHTLKGLFLQLECSHAAQALEALEGGLSELRRGGDVATADIVTLLADGAIDTALEKDMEVVREALGQEFFNRRGEVGVGAELAAALAALADRLLARLDELPLDAADADVLEAARGLTSIDLRKLLAAYPRTAQRLAAAQGKELTPFVVEGETVLVDPQRFEPLAKSMIHLFRNAVDHGLESPEDRVAAGKAPAGRLTCRVTAGDGQIRIEVGDDGRGVDIAAVRARAFELGLAGAEELASLDDAAVMALVFRDGFTSRRQAGSVSGRGVGLSAVRAETERLGGGVTLENVPGGGSRLTLVVPLDRNTPKRERV